jgi:hypothetical protein
LSALRIRVAKGVRGLASSRTLFVAYVASLGVGLSSGMDRLR